jgi:hypothetical protein
VTTSAQPAGQPTTSTVPAAALRRATLGATIGSMYIMAAAVITLFVIQSARETAPGRQKAPAREPAEAAAAAQGAGQGSGQGGR